MIRFLFLFLFASISCERSFKIVGDSFVKDGAPFRYISGEIHYNRIHPAYWNDRLARVRAAGLNAVQVYVPWNLHEPFEGQFTFEGFADLPRFLELAQNNSLLVLLRPGPYICAEWENGGLPYWLLKKDGIALRKYNIPFITAVDNYFKVLLAKVRPQLYVNGGPVIMVQVENEYGSYDSDKRYKLFLKNLFVKYLGTDAVLYTTDGAGESYVTRGMIDGVFPTVDFGPTSRDTVSKAFQIQRNFSNNGPIVNSEFYPGWFTLWGDGQPQLPTTAEVLDTMQAMWEHNASFSFYMFHGGTNFGFFNGAETNGAVITSYDYGAPISESGDITPRYLAIREWLQTLKGWDRKPLAVPKNNSVKAYGEVSVKKVHQLIEGLSTSLTSCRQSENPLSFEDIDHPYGFVVYRTVLTVSGTNLSAPNLKDHGYVYLNKKKQGTIYHNFLTTSKKWINLSNAQVGDELFVLVENRGRQTYLSILDRKGLLPDITLDGQVLRNWTQCGVDVGEASRLANLDRFVDQYMEEAADADSSGVYFGSFDIDDGAIADTWLHPRGFRKGQVFVNGFNVGRYWKTGPQVTLYVPGPVLKRKNSIIVVELLGNRDATEKVIEFVDKPIYKDKKYFPRSVAVGRHKSSKTEV